MKKAIVFGITVLILIVMSCGKSDYEKVSNGQYNVQVLEVEVTNYGYFGMRDLTNPDITYVYVTFKSNDPELETDTWIKNFKNREDRLVSASFSVSPSAVWNKEGKNLIEFIILRQKMDWSLHIQGYPPVPLHLDLTPEEEIESREVEPPPPPQPLKGEEEEADDDHAFVPYDEAPAPVGGLIALQQKLVYPKTDREAGIEGRVILNVKFNEQGEVLKIEVLKSVSPTLDQAAMDAVKAVEWKPARQKGKAVALWYYMPVVFRLM